MMGLLAVDATEAGRLLGNVSERTVERLIATGELRSIVVGTRLRRIPVEAIRDYIESKDYARALDGSGRHTTKGRVGDPGASGPHENGAARKRRRRGGTRHALYGKQPRA